MDLKNNQKFNLLNRKSKIYIILFIIVIMGILVGIYLNSSDIFNSVPEKEYNDTKTNNSDISSSLNEKEYIGPKPNITIAVLGHKNHGKSTLTSALTKLYGNYVTTDELEISPQINKNNVVYNASFVEYETLNRHYSHYDMPTFDDYSKALASKSVKLDGAILVVAATDGSLSETRKSLELLKNAGVSKVVVFINKCDLVEDENLLILVEIEIRELLNLYGFAEEETPIIRGSALKALEGDKKYEQSIIDLMDAIENWIAK